MEENGRSSPPRSLEGVGIGLALGVGIGVSLGVALENWGLGLGIGVAIGVTFAIAFSAHPNTKPGAAEDPEDPASDDGRPSP